MVMCTCCRVVGNCPGSRPRCPTGKGMLISAIIVRGCVELFDIHCRVYVRGGHQRRFLYLQLWILGSFLENAPTKLWRSALCSRPERHRSAHRSPPDPCVGGAAYGSYSWREVRAP